jgi:hypothetical protein
MNDLTQPLADYIQKQIKCSPDHAQLLAVKLLAILPSVFESRPEFFTLAIASMPIKPPTND